MALAFYRKYRPQKLGELLGQETNVEILKNAARQNRIGHAYLFYGPRGTGKTTTARLLAKLLNCEEREANSSFMNEGEPCGTCRTCLEIENGNALDLVEIDAASNRGIDEIRNLKENIGVSPLSSKYKVYIIDEAHMLTGPAFNALLKTLEEPPRHAVLILATTEYEKLPATITSRTQRFLFKKLSRQTILAKLTQIAKLEKIKISPDALELVAAGGEGSFRDAESLLDQISAAADTIDLPTAERLTGRVGLKKVEQLAELVLAKDVNGALAHLAHLNDEGQNIIQFTKDLIHYLRKVVAVNVNPTLTEFLATELTSEELERLKKLSGQAPLENNSSLTGQASTEWTVTFIKNLIRAYGEMRYSPFASIPLELVLIESLKTKES